MVESIICRRGAKALHVYSQNQWVVFRTYTCSILESFACCVNNHNTCMRMRRSADSLLWKRWSENSRRTLSTAARSSGVPRSGSNSHTARPKKPLVDRSHGLSLPCGPTFSLHMLLLLLVRTYLNTARTLHLQHNNIVVIYTTLTVYMQAN